MSFKTTTNKINKFSRKNKKIQRKMPFVENVFVRIRMLLLQYLMIKTRKTLMKTIENVKKISLFRFISRLAT